MKSPFLFGRTVSRDLFTNRVQDTARLASNLQNHINTILISPRRWGKSSLVHKVAADMSGRSRKVVMLDLLSIRNEEEFYKQFAGAVIKATSGKLSDVVQTAKEFFKNIRPKISVGTDPAVDFEVSFEWKEVEKNFREILNLPEKIASQKKLHIIICIDEFQNCAEFLEPLLFQKRLRTEWQHQKHVTYCLYGSRQHMIAGLFEKQSMPFYKFGDVMYLPKITRTDWVNFIQRQFKSTHKNISAELAGTIAGLMEDHSYYVQQLSYLIWLGTSRAVTKAIISEALDTMLAQNALLYTRDAEGLSNVQHNFLRAVAGGMHTGLSSRETVYEYRLGSSANVVKVKKALLDKELIEETNAGVYFLDPAFRLWFQRHILKTEIILF